MPQSVIVAGAGSDERYGLCEILEWGSFRAVPLSSMEELVETVQKSIGRAIILDLDTMPVDNALIKEIRKLNPLLCIIGISSRTFHPELEEALRTNISVCLTKPVDVDQLFYWLRSVCGGQGGSSA
ncbi:MAG: hypothetical protein AAGU11_18265 [Syntrophobacteraceae bacterium]